uniref:Uncharacterized protein n=1 Tax=Ananas comosus var. bracteatus TaxID=296719 RepID=A0A6V7QA75_ANACO|nr:unnamed protein product [Ananas comosus var. bracteatus]
MYVDVKLNGKTTRAMVDTGATHNFIATGEAEHLGLTLSKDGSRIKAVNSKAQPIAGLAKKVSISIGSWTDNRCPTDFSTSTQEGREERRADLCGGFEVGDWEWGRNSDAIRSGKALEGIQGCHAQNYRNLYLPDEQ